MEITQEQTIGQLVAANYRTAAVFKKYNIDFCCNGNRTIAAAAIQNNTDFIQLEKELALALEVAGSDNIDYKSWSLDLLADYVEKKHHRYVKAQIPVIGEYLIKLCKVHGQKHPELFEINELFDDSATEFKNHMQKEELMLFPYIRKLALAKQEHKPAQPAPFGTVQNPIQMMMNEHLTEGERFRKISALSDNYVAPADGCNTYRVAFALLKEFEDDLHLHIHIENNILFPKAIELEAALNS
ncbi:MAG: iron-sulfur cluster repair di-iron protein [Bacteroidota bacterium]